ncbi:class I SAM-dependent methyltransferase [Nostoc flagelliforme FACHB-838]|uniref:Class I SAM-dependent methyltransferase n=1 Tax=Nostoc flagelliforme FACHB-838 TaxID=2692904 RepID=A0ABR8DW39_9NOSO|nr:cyclopropane-fatty-acyl-phospholipid synthase family protein [Nostoc flagelliforme]MBD2533672.1 class I SAM-dependent methyltransferase [Nostoc flagelliforme FACHB-838]
MTTLNTVTPGASHQAIQHHYDVGNDFYQIWLDSTMTYSCAIWEEGETESALELAQIRKVDFHINQAKAKNTKRVLDIGCGWGTVLQRLVEVYGVEQAVGLTLSEAQKDWISTKKHPQIEVNLQSWLNYSPTEPFDAIISIGAFEHFVKPELSSNEKIDVYRTFFTRCHEWLKPGGSMSIQTIAYGKRKPEEVQKNLGAQFANQEIFPESDSPRLTEITAAAEGIFEVISVHNDRMDYVRTLEAWLSKLRSKRTEVINLVGKTVFERYERYLYLALLGFLTGDLLLLRLTFRRIN